jgi:hypothetical protein
MAVGPSDAGRVDVVLPIFCVEYILDWDWMLKVGGVAIGWVV